ncbi:Hypothetical_protein [Hexamita inflata]|uniref:Hypothetical_protein n=1 Tax=Hexamita inflata TaxID=28002 RepID=A0AA86NBJ5_9EUKA|nr:Hypothetical protein HINF_LOCUS3833 [Hexamita inflata]
MLVNLTPFSLPFSAVTKDIDLAIEMVLINAKISYEQHQQARHRTQEIYSHMGHMFSTLQIASGALISLNSFDIGSDSFSSQPQQKFTYTTKQRVLAFVYKQRFDAPVVQTLAGRYSQRVGQRERVSFYLVQIP